MWTIDRFEGDFAVCEKENGEMINIPKISIVGNPREGDILIDQYPNYVIDKNATLERKETIDHLLKKLWKKN